MLSVICLTLLTPIALARPFDGQWCEYQSPHVVLITDLKERRARRALAELHRFRHLFDTLFPRTDTPSYPPARVLFFRHQRDFIAATNSTHFAGFTVPGLYEYLILLGPLSTDTTSNSLLHEYAHYLMRTRQDVSYPMWYEEGLATYLGAVGYRKKGAVLGELPGDRGRDITQHESLSWQAMVDTTSLSNWSHRRLTAFYNKSWFVVHFLRLGQYVGFPDRREQLAAYIASSQRSFEASFAVTPENLGITVNRYLRKRRVPVERLNFAPPDAPVAQRQCLTDAERDLQLGHSLAQHAPALARSLLEPLVHANPQPTSLVALSRAQAQDPDMHTLPALKTADRALELTPDFAPALIQRANLSIRSCVFIDGAQCAQRWRNAAEDYRKALRSDPARYDAAFGLGVAYLHAGRAGDALNYLRVAHDKAPWAAPVNFYLGEGYRIVGDTRSVRHLENARHWAADALWRSRAEAALERLKTR